MRIGVTRIGVDGEAASGEDGAPARGSSAPAGWRVAVVVSRYNAWITRKLEEGALGALDRLSGGAGEAVVVGVSGSLEIPAVVAEAAAVGGYDAVVALGCVIKGETDHDRHIAAAIITSLVETSAASGVAIGVGVLTVNDADQAEARAGGVLGNKGAEAMEAAIASAGAMGELRRMAGADGVPGQTGDADG